jgi:hypothetical protein
MLLLAATSRAPVTFRDGNFAKVRDGDAVFIGRHPECEVILALHFVNRRNAKVTRAGDSVVVTDLGSTNGLTIKGRHVGRSAALQVGDSIDYVLAPGKPGTRLELLQVEDDSLFRVEPYGPWLAVDANGPPSPGRRRALDLRAPGTIATLVSTTQSDVLARLDLVWGQRAGLPRLIDRFTTNDGLLEHRALDIGDGLAVSELRVLEGTPSAPVALRILTELGRAIALSRDVAGVNLDVDLFIGLRPMNVWIIRTPEGANSS